MLFLAQHVKKVYIICQGEEIRVEPINKKCVYENDKIEVLIFDNHQKFNIDGVFIEIVSHPVSKLAENLDVKLNKKKSKYLFE